MQIFLKKNADFCKIFAKFALKFDFVGVLMGFLCQNGAGYYPAKRTKLIRHRRCWTQDNLCWITSNSTNDALNPNAISGNGRRSDVGILFRRNR